MQRHPAAPSIEPTGVWVMLFLAAQSPAGCNARAGRSAADVQRRRGSSRDFAPALEGTPQLNVPASDPRVADGRGANPTSHHFRTPADAQRGALLDALN
jgi:hypothetical protein